MTKKDRILNILNENRNQFKAIGVKSIGIFGSIARRNDNEDSDIDILVEFDQNSRKFRNFNALCDLLETHFGKSCDLVTIDGLSPYIRPEILKEVEYADLSH